MEADRDNVITPAVQPSRAQVVVETVLDRGGNRLREIAMVMHLARAGLVLLQPLRGTGGNMLLRAALATVTDNSNAATASTTSMLTPPCDNCATAVATSRATTTSPGTASTSTASTGTSAGRAGLRHGRSQEARGSNYRRDKHNPSILHNFHHPRRSGQAVARTRQRPRREDQAGGAGGGEDQTEESAGMT
jgi:hypothetical protein